MREGTGTAWLRPARPDTGADVLEVFAVGALAGLSLPSDRASESDEIELCALLEA